MSRLSSLTAIIVTLSALVAPGNAFARAPTTGTEVATFLAPQSDLLEPYPGPGLPVPITEFKDQTVRQIVRVSIGGASLKIKFSNEFGKAPLTLNAVRVAASLGLGAIDIDTSKPVTFGGRTSVTIAPGGQVYSDRIDYPVKALSELAVSIYMQDAAVRTGHRFSNTTSYVVSGDATSTPTLEGAQAVASTYFMPEILTVARTKPIVVVALGDSITDTGASTKDAHKSWPDQLSTMANATFNASVLNGGIGGNRWVRNNMGPCGLCRFKRDVLSVEGVTHVVLQLGINDIGLSMRFANGFKDSSQTVSAAQIIANMQEAINLAKRKGIKVYLTTIVPFKGPMTDYYTTGKPDQIPFGSTQPYNGEQVRQEVNAFIRGNRDVDGIIDFDRALSDPKDPLSQRREYTAEGLHPNDAGGALLARLAYLSVFRGE